MSLCGALKHKSVSAAARLRVGGVQMLNKRHHRIEQRSSCTGKCGSSYIDPFMVVFVSFLASMIVCTKTKCYPMLGAVLEAQFPKVILSRENEWIGISYACFSLLPIPLCTGVVEVFGISYRWAVAISGVLQLVGSVASSSVFNPGYLLLTDGLINGLGSSLMLSVIILVVDDYFPHESGCRVTATSFVQGTLLADFLLVGLYSAAQSHLGWRAMYILQGGLLFTLTVLAAVFFSDNDGSKRSCLPLLGRRRDHDNSLEFVAVSAHWRSKLLGITADDFEQGIAVVPWLTERFILYTITNGVFGGILIKTGFLEHPVNFNNLAGHISIQHNSFYVVALMFSLGSTTSYIIVAIVMNLYYRWLLTVYAFASLCAFGSLVIWQIIVKNHHTYFVVNMLFGWLAGTSLGALHSGTFAASRVATDIAARRIFPLTRMMQVIRVVLPGLMLQYCLFSGLVVRDNQFNLENYSKLFKKSGNQFCHLWIFGIAKLHLIDLYFSFAQHQSATIQLAEWQLSTSKQTRTNNIYHETRTINRWWDKRLKEFRYFGAWDNRSKSLIFWQIKQNSIFIIGKRNVSCFLLYILFYFIYIDMHMQYDEYFGTISGPVWKWKSASGNAKRSPQPSW